MDRATVDHLLTTTRTVRRRLDLTKPVEPLVIQECLEIAIQAPNGGNQNRSNKRIQPTARRAGPRLIRHVRRTGRQGRERFDGTTA
jgi:hypothetical protein